MADTTRKIKVLHILDELNTGGAERIVFSYFLHIDHTKFQWDFVMTRYADSKKKGLLEDKIEEIGGHIYRVHRKRENYIKNIQDIDHIIKKGHYDVVHSHLDELSAFYLASAKKYGVNVRICHSHLACADRGRTIEMLCKVLKPWMKHLSTDWFACGIDAGIALWGKNAVESGKVHIMHNAIDTTKFAYNEETRNLVRQQLGVANEMLFGSVGRLSYQKNSEFIIEIFNAYHKNDSNSRLIVVGEGEKMGEMKELVAKYKLDDCVSFLGARNDVNELMMAMDVFLLPSRFEGLPIVMVEAQCTGLTCAVSNTTTDEIKINQNVHYYPLNQRPDEWAQGIKMINKLANREVVKQKICEAGYEISVEAKKLEDYYIKAVRK